jgi:hypothetical protein
MIHFVNKALQCGKTGLAASLACAFLLLFGALSKAQETTLPPPRASDRYPPAPDPKRVFRLESEPDLRERMIREGREGINPIAEKYEFVPPEYPSVPKEIDITRRWEPLSEMVEPPYVCYHRLYFEQINAERYGWDLGLGHPLVSAGVFFWDVAWLPYHAFTEPFRRYECNAGYYLPGDPVPLLLYPPELNLPGALAEAAVIGLGFAIFP